MDFMSILGPLLSVAGPMAGGLLSSGGQTSQTQTQNNQVAPWLLPYQKAQVERQLNISNKPFQDYPGFYQQFAQAMQQEQAPEKHPWDNFQNARAGTPVGGYDKQQFVDRTNHPYNPLTAKPGEQVPLQLNRGDYIRYNQNLSEDPNYHARTMSNAQMAEWKKANRGLKQFMTDKPYALRDNVFNQQVQQNLAAAQQQQAPNIIDQYFAPRALKGLLG